MAVTTAESPPQPIEPDRVPSGGALAPPPAAARVSGHTWIWQVTGLCVALGILLGFALRTQWHYRKAQLPGMRFSTLAPYYLSLKEANDRLQKEVSELRQQGSNIENRLATESQATQHLNDQLQDVKLFAGLTPVTGSGLEITLQDSPKDFAKIKLPEGTDVNELRNEARIHDQDINAIVSELKAAGAEAIAISGVDRTQKQRVTALTTARCAGPGVKVNDTVFGAPYTIFAIGNPKDLESQLRLQGGVVDMSSLQLMDMIRIMHRDKLVLPGYSGSMNFRFAHPTE
jgi:uncharacterized protein YlxW (UPF0749 family)